MPAIIYAVLKEFYVEIHGQGIKARIISPLHHEDIFIFQVSSFYKSSAEADPYEPASEFTSYANAERHLIQYLETFQSAIDLGGEFAAGNRF